MSLPAKHPAAALALAALAPALVLVTAACPGARARKPDRAVPDGPPPPPGNFEPAAPLPDPAPPDPRQPGLAYLQQLHPRLGEPWATFLENCRLYFPPAHPLNDPALAARMAITIDRDGGLVNAAFTQPSGNADYDAAALEIVRDAAPFPAPDRKFVSDDDAVHVTWLFARDRRQAGVATATLERIEWPAERAVPKFLAAGDTTAAAQRLERALREQPNGPGAALDKLGGQIAEAVIREGLRAEDVHIQRAGVAAAADGKLLAAAPELRTIVESSVDIALRGEAIAALGAIGDEGAAPLLIDVLETAKGSGVGGAIDNGAAAARALATLGRDEVAGATVAGWLEAGDPESLWAALVVMAEFSVPAAIPRLSALLTGAATDRAVRVAACTALGSATTRASAAAGTRALRAGLAAGDAIVRAACARGTAAAAAAGVRSRASYWKLVELMKHRDDRVRSAAVLAAARLEPTRFAKELYLVRKERSPAVLAALAQGLAQVSGPEARRRLVALAREDDPAVRRPALESLLARGEPADRAVVAESLGDDDPRVRVIAIRAATDPAALRALLDDASPEVQRAAMRGLIRVQGKRAALPELAARLARPGADASRVALAHAWLAPAE